VHRRQIDARDQKQRRPGDPRQDHRADGDRAGDKQVQKRPDAKLRKVDAQRNRRVLAQQRKPHDERRAEQRQRRVPRGISQRTALRAGYQRKRRRAQPQKQTAHKIDVQLK